MRLVVVGGGVAATCCAEELLQRDAQLRAGGGAGAARGPLEVVLVAPEDRAELRRVAGVRPLTRGGLVHAFEVVRGGDLAGAARGPHASFRFVRGVAAGLDARARRLRVRAVGAGPGEAGAGPGEEDEELAYDRLCVCTGASPRLPVPRARGGAHVTTLRDAESVGELCRRLAAGAGGGRRPRVLLVGNGGIALELAAALARFDVSWSVRHQGLADSFFDRDAAAFLRAVVYARRRAASGAGAGGEEAPARGGFVFSSAPRAKRRRAAGDAPGGAEVPPGHAAGPDWLASILALSAGGAAAGGLDILLGTELESVAEGADGLEARLADGTALRADVVIGAVGVSPNTRWLGGAVALAGADRGGGGGGGGVLVDRRMRASCEGVFAAGDCCDARAFEDAQARDAGAARPLRTWSFQMRLWTQARMMGMYAARCMLGDADEDIAFGINMELFTHVTSFCGMKVVLLGLYNGQTLEECAEEDFVSYTRATELPEGVGGEEVDGASFVRILLYRGRVVGAVLIGESGLEETIENLILDQLDVSGLGPAILDPDVDIEDYFD